MFNEVYSCVPVEETEGAEFNFSGRIFLPHSALLLIMNLFADQELPALLNFRIEGPTGKSTHCSVKEFTSEPDLAYLPAWMMRQLELKRNDKVNVRLVNLPVGTTATFRINKKDEFLPNDPVVNSLNFKTARFD